MMIDEMVVDDPLHQLELVVVLKRLGLSYHFEYEIDKMLENIYNNIDHFREEKGYDLYAPALAFRLFRQHHFNIPQEFWSHFMNKSENFKEWPSEDINQILRLYEATYLSIEDEHILEKTKDFSIKHLQEYVKSMPWSSHSNGGCQGWKPSGSLMCTRKDKTIIGFGRSTYHLNACLLSDHHQSGYPRR